MTRANNPDKGDQLMSLPRTLRNQPRFNRAVTDRLRDTSPEHAEALGSRGETLGWWNTVSHFYFSGRSVFETAEAITKEPIKPIPYGWDYL